MFNEFYNIIVRSLKLDKTLYKDNRNFGEAAIYFAGSIMILDGVAGAVAAKLCMGAMGSDTGGSIRIPATFCGIVGFKPTFGLVSRSGILPVSWSLDTVGPMTRNVRDAALILNAIVGHDPKDNSTTKQPIKDFSVRLDKGIDGIRIGVLTEAFSAVIEPEIREILRKAVSVLKDLGSQVYDTSISLTERREFTGVIMQAEYASVHLKTYSSQKSKIGNQALKAIEDGLRIKGVDYVKAHQNRIQFNRDFDKIWKHFDVLVGPTERITAPTIENSPNRKVGESQNLSPGLSSLAKLFNTTGSPAITVPCGFASNGMPVGMQVVARSFQDTRVLQVAQAYENATKWHRLQPSI